MIRIILSLVPLLFILSSCDDSPEYGSTAVVEGFINSQGTCVVWFSSSAVPQNKDVLSDKVFKWGTVTLSDGTSEIQLKAQPISGNFPPFRFYETDIDIRPGVTYTVTARYRNYTVTGSSRMTTPPAIDRIEVLPVEGHDSLRTVNLYFTAPDDVPAYYYVTMRTLGRYSQELPCMLSTTQAYEPGKQICIPVYTPKTYRIDKHYQTFISAGQDIILTLYRINKDVYDYWLAFFNMQLFSSSPILGNNSSLPNTVSGGYGVWSAQGGDAVCLSLD